MPSLSFSVRYALYRLLILLFILTPLLSSQTVDSLFYGNSKKLLRNLYGWGFITGTKEYRNIGKYQRFDIPEDANIVGAKIWMGFKRIIHDPDTITNVFKKTAYGADNYDPKNGGPGLTVAKLKTTPNIFDTSGVGSVFLLPSSFNVTGSVFLPESIIVDMEWSVASDHTFALFSDSASQGKNAYRRPAEYFSFNYAPATPLKRKG